MEKKGLLFGTKSEAFNRGFKFCISVFFVVGFTLLITMFLPKVDLVEGSIDIGLFALIPAVFLIGYIFITKRILEALILATLMCFIFSDRTNFLTAFNEGLTSVMMDEDTAWLIVVCGLMGSIIKLIEKTGGSFAFGDFVARHSN